MFALWIYGSMGILYVSFGCAFAYDGHLEKQRDQLLKPFNTGSNLLALDESLWTINWHSSSEASYLDGTGAFLVPMVTKDEEQYDCRIQQTDLHEMNEADSSEGTPFTYLAPLFEETACSYRLESFWTYELCHGRHIRQLHETKQGKVVSVIEFFLGKYTPDDRQRHEREYEEMIRVNPNFKPRYMKTEDVSHPYFEMVYRGGSICDLTGEPRLTRVRYVCHEKGGHEIISFQETSSCQYLMVVLSSLLCKDVKYRTSPSAPLVVDCVARADSPSRPRALLQLQADRLLQRHGATSNRGLHGVIEQLLSKPQPAAVGQLRGDASTEPGVQQRPTAPDDPAGTRRPAYDDKLVQAILSGEHCLYGGSGWWRYELCYGRRASQFHDHPDGSRTVIDLGFFQLPQHLAWLADNPHKVPGNTQRRAHVSHLYTGGSHCQLTDTHRQVEVKIKCLQTAAAVAQPNAVSMYLLEPRPCHYVLGVESAIFCPLVEAADPGTGLLSSTLQH